MGIRAIVTGATGMVGKGVLLECLESPDVESVLAVNRHPLGIKHPKLKEIIHGDFFNLAPIEGQLAGYHACFFCLGVSSAGMSEENTPASPTTSPWASPRPWLASIRR